jgi:hypothetical protein
MLHSSETKLGQSRHVRWLALALALATVGLAACGDDDGDENGAATTPSADSDLSADPGGGSEEIVIKTDLTIPNGEVLEGSSIGGTPFCPGGTFHDKPGDAEIGSVDRTIRCPDGNVRIGFSPSERPGLTETGPWKVVSGTGAYEGLRGRGQMEVTFEPHTSALEGRETFTGTVVP